MKLTLNRDWIWNQHVGVLQNTSTLHWIWWMAVTFAHQCQEKFFRRHGPKLSRIVVCDRLQSLLLHYSRSQPERNSIVNEKHKHISQAVPHLYWHHRHQEYSLEALQVRTCAAQKPKCNTTKYESNNGSKPFSFCLKFYCDRVLFLEFEKFLSL